MRTQALSSTLNKKKLQSFLEAGTLQAELMAAYTYVDTRTSPDALGKACQLRTPEQMLATKDVRGGVYFGGSLRQLNLRATAYNTLDVSAMDAALDSETLEDLIEKVNPVEINLDELPANAQSMNVFQGLKRLDKDGEVATLCLLIKWADDDGKEGLRDCLKDAAQDLTFIGQHKGIGSKLFSQKFSSVNKADKKRLTMGMSAWRQSLFLSDYQFQCITEGRFPKETSVYVRLFKCMQQDEVEGFANYSPDTLSRYALVGKALSPDVQKILMRWESQSKRTAFVDSVAVMRAIVQSCPTQDDMMYCLRLLKQQQLRLSRHSQRSLASIAETSLSDRSFGNYNLIISDLNAS